MTTPRWRKSARCSANNGCVEWVISSRSVLVRDGKDPHGSKILVFARPAFAAFVRTLKAAP